MNVVARIKGIKVLNEVSIEDGILTDRIDGLATLLLPSGKEVELYMPIRQAELDILQVNSMQELASLVRDVRLTDFRWVNEGEIVFSDFEAKRDGYAYNLIALLSDAEKGLIGKAFDKVEEANIMKMFAPQPTKAQVVEPAKEEA